MRLTRRVATAVAAAATAGVVGAAATYAWSGTDASDAEAGRALPDPASAARTSFPGLEPASGEPGLEGITTSRPEPGTVLQVPGPFDDRFELGRLDVSDGAVSGRLRITSDVSELIELEVLVGFYDAEGRFLGSASHVHHLDEGHGHEEGTGPPAVVERFRVVAPEDYAAQVRSAAVGVPVLVNE